jgi:hypothetical protein
MTIPNISNDMCRCHDDSCPEKEQCLRWLRREDPDRCPHVATLRPFHVSSDDECPAMMPYGGDE